MKKVLFAALLLAGSNATFAQVSQGQWMVGGSIDFTHSSLDDDKQTDFNISPNLGYFVINQLAVGLRPEFGYTKSKTKTGSTTVTSSRTDISVAPFVRYYFMPSGQKVNVFGDASYGFGSSKVKGFDAVSANYFQIKAGPAIFLTPNTALEAAVFYRSNGGDAYPNDNLNQFGLSVGFQIHLGGK